MNPFRCFVCREPSIEFPQDFKAILIDFIGDLNKFQPSSLNCSELNKLLFCQSCWIPFMRVHKLDRQLSLKQKTVEAKVKLLSAKIRGARRSSGATGNIPTSCKNLNVKTSVLLRAQNESREEESADTTKRELQQVEPLQLVTVDEDKTVRKKWTLPVASRTVKRLSEADFIYMDKYPFKAIGKGFKCGLCPKICNFDNKSYRLWKNMIQHIDRYHKGKRRAGPNKGLHHRFIEIAPNRFQYRKYMVDEINGNYRCEECGVIKAAATGKRGKAVYIMKHILLKHASETMTFVCEYCGKVYRSQIGLKHHRSMKHEKPQGQFPCKDCDRIFPTRFKASAHRHQVHLHREEFVCESCGKKFNCKGVLRNHAAWAHNRQKVKCQDCGKMFGSKIALSVHRYSHTGKKYTCDVCGMDFTQSYSVVRHKKTAHPQ